MEETPGLDPLDVKTEDFEAYLYKWGEEVERGAVLRGPETVDVEALSGMPIYRNGFEVLEDGSKGPLEIIGVIHTFEKDKVGVKARGRIIEGALEKGDLALGGKVTYYPGTGDLIIKDLSIEAITLITKDPNND